MLGGFKCGVCVWRWGRRTPDIIHSCVNRGKRLIKHYLEVHFSGDSFRSPFTCLNSGLQSSHFIPSFSPLISSVIFISISTLFCFFCLSSLLLFLYFSQSLSEGDRMVSQHSSEALCKRPRATYSVLRECLSFLNLS